MSTPWDMQTIERPDGVRLATWTRPADVDEAPTVVLVHGYPDTHLMWEQLTGSLPAGYRLVTYDVRGAGESTAPRPPEGYRLAHLADDLAAVIAATAPSGRAHVVGHDWGGITGFHAAASDAAGAIASLTAVSAASLAHAAEWVRRRLRPSSMWPAGLLEAGGQALRSWYVGAFQLPLAPRFMAAAVGGLADRLDGLDPGTRPTAPTAARDAANGVWLYRANRGHAVSPHAQPIQVPLQLILGAADPFISPRMHDDLERWAPDGQRVLLRGGHWLPVTHPEEVGARITSLVDAVESSDRPSADA